MTVRSALCSVLWCGLMLSFLIPRAYGHREIPESFEDLVNRTERIVLASCLRSVKRVDETLQAQFVFVEFARLESVKGALPKQFSLRLPDGPVSHYLVPPAFSPGEEVILFVGRDGPGGYPGLVSWSKGIYRTKRHPQSGERIFADPRAVGTIQDFLNFIRRLLR
ncbi:hypothetical protein L0156_30950 [bacterium]|nr:hypothetical protein [bacterium]